MATSVLANWHGHDYQARYFWIEASRLKNPQQDFVVEVSYEADGPKAFDDVITRYNPPPPQHRARSDSGRLLSNQVSRYTSR